MRVRGVTEEVADLLDVDTAPAEARGERLVQAHVQLAARLRSLARGRRRLRVHASWLILAPVSATSGGRLLARLSTRYPGTAPTWGSVVHIPAHQQDDRAHNGEDEECPRSRHAVVVVPWLGSSTAHCAVCRRRRVGLRGRRAFPVARWPAGM